MRHWRDIGFTMALLASVSGPAAAQVSADQAAALERDLRGWAADLVRPLLDAAAIPLRITAEGDRYRAELGAGAIPGVTVTSAGATTGFLRPLGGSRWAVEEFRLPAEIVADIGMAGAASHFTMRVAEQQIKAEIDPSLASPTRYGGRMRGVIYNVETATGTKTTKMDSVVFDTNFTPTTTGMLSGGGTSTIEGYGGEQSLPDGTDVTYTVDRVTSTSRAESVNAAGLVALLHNAIALGTSVAGDLKTQTADAPRGAPTDAQRGLMRQILDSASSAFSSVEAKQTWSGIKFQAGPFTGSLAEVTFGSAIGAPGGNAEFRMRLGASGLASPMLPPGAIGQFVPKQIAIAPRISGVPKQALTAFLAHAIDVAGSDDSELGAEAMQLLADNPVTVGIDELNIDIGAARLTGTGQVQVAAPTDVTGAAELRMTGMDPLMRMVGQSPETKAAMPVLIMLKGLGKVEGNATVWRLAYAGNKLTVNGTDVSGMMPAGR